MSSRRGFRTGSNSYGQFWFGGNSFPGFLYKKNVGVGARRSTQFTPGGTTICNQPNEFWNKYKPGTGGIGGSSVATRRAKLRLATVCNEQGKCGNFYKYLGLFDNYTGNGLLASYPILNTKELLKLAYLMRLGIPYDAAFYIIYNGNPEILVNKFFTPTNMPETPFSGNITNNLTLPNTYLNNWYQNGTGPITLVTNYNSTNWLYSNNLPPNNSNSIAFQNTALTSDGVYLYQYINSTLYHNTPYILTFYSTNRGNTHYNSDPTQLWLYFKINDQTILTNYNPQSSIVDNLPWKFVSIPFIWNGPTMSNAVLTIGQVQTITSDLTIFVTQPSLKINI